MHDVFLSYASSDRPVVEQLAKLFEQRGWTTWWDRKLIPGAQFAETIRQALKEARCVVVVWSESSTKSIWVKSEAGQALHESKLVSLCIDGAKLPMPFDQLHALDMTGWLPPSHHPKLSALISAVAALLPAQVERTEPVKPQEKGTTVEIQAAYAPAGGLAPIILNVGLRHEHRSLSVALKEASDNTEIVLEGGEYSEDALVIDKPVTIRASGENGAATIRTSGTIQVTASAQLIELEIQYVGGPGQNAVSVTGGSPTLADCKIHTSEGGFAGIFAMGDVHPAIVRCQITGTAGIGIIVGIRATALIEDCDISGHAGHGIGIIRFGRAHLIRSRVHHNGDFGVAVQKRGALYGEGNEIFANKHGGVEVRGGSRGELRGNDIAGNDQGIRFSDDATGFVQKCSISDHQVSGIFALTRSSVEICHNRIFKNREMGVAAFSQAKLTVRTNDIHDNSLSGVSCQGVDAEFQDNRLSSNAEAGLRAEGSNLTITGNEISGNRMSGVIIFEGRQCTFRSNHIYANGEAGIRISRGEAKLIGNHCHDNNLSAVIVLNQGQTLIRSNDLSENKEHGVKVSEHSHAVIEDNALSRNGLSGVWTGEGASSQIRRNNIDHSFENGVYVVDGGNATISNNVISNSGLQGIACHGAVVTAEQNRIVDSRKIGVWADAGASLTLKENEIVGSGQSGISATKGSKIIAAANSVKGSCDAGIVCEIGAEVQNTANAFSDNTWGDFLEMPSTSDAPRS